MSDTKLTTLNKLKLADFSYRSEKVSLRNALEKSGLQNIKVEAIAQGKYVEDGLNAVIYSTEIEGKKEYIVGNAGTNPVSISDVQQNAQFLKDLDDDLQIAIGKTPDQAADLKAFVEDFKSDHGINEPFQGVEPIPLGVFLWLLLLQKTQNYLVT